MRWGIVDVDAWLKSLPAGALDEWQAYDIVESLDEWHHTGTIAAAVTNAMCQLAAAMAGGDWEPVDPEAFRPKPAHEHRAKERARQMAGQKAHDYLASRYG